MGLSVINLSYTVPNGKQVLQGIDFELVPGRMVALMGPSGSGKTTFLDVLASRREGDTIKGDIYINGISRKTEAGRKLFTSRAAYMLQLAAAFSETLTVHENLMLAAALRLPNTSATEQLERATRVIKMVGLAERANVVVGGATGGGLSGGQKRKLSLAVEVLGIFDF